MNRYVLSCLISLLFIVSANIKSQEGQKKPAQINILNAESMEAPYPGMDSDGIRLLGDVLLRHEDVLMRCDSAHRFSSTNMVYAFGNVHINQGDTLHLYGDRIIYHGNRRYAEVRQNVRLMDNETTLTTEYLDFNLRDEYGYYPNRGVVINGDNRLESIKGYYYTNEKLFYFQDSVRITNPDYIINSDTLKYNTVTEVVYFLGPTTIIGDETNIYCENGWYNTKTDIAQFNENARVTNNNQVLSADSIWFDNRNGLGEAFRDLSVTDTIENIVIRGEYGWFMREPEQVFVTDRALFIQFFENDTLYLHADTLRSWVQITGPDIIPSDTPGIRLDTENEPGSSPVSGNGNGQSTENTTDPEASENTTDPEASENEPPTEEVGAEGSPVPEAGENDMQPESLLDALPQNVAAPAPFDTLSAYEITAAGHDAADDTIIPDTIPVRSHIPPENDLAASNDTLLSDTIPTPSLIPPQRDTTRIMVAYYGVRIFSNDMQGKCDSLYYNMKDSIIYMFQEPVLWSDESQLTADYMELHTRNGEADHVVMKNSAFIVSEEESGLYNQIKGNEITGYFNGGELYRVNVSGNAETLYYPTENHEIIGINKAASSRLIIFLKENKPDRIRFLTRPEATLYPLDEVPAGDRLLQNFQWLDHIRPKSREDVFNKP
jgi:lipopolysaccharide export system protein LptA